MFNKVILGGTFDFLHAGHKKTLSIAFDVGKKIAIGLTSDEFARRFKTVEVNSYEERIEKLREFCRKFNKPYEIIPIDDIYGIATLDSNAECIVVSEETLLRAEEINSIRFKKNLDKLVIVVVPLVLADNGKPISSNDISKGRMDSEGGNVRLQ